MRITQNHININPIVINHSYKNDVLRASVIEPAKKVNPVLDREYDVTIGHNRYTGVIRNVVGSVGVLLAAILVLCLL